MTLAVRLETHPDLDEIARLANEAFGRIGQAFTAERLDWLYHRAFSSRALVLGLFDGNRKVGQVALLRQAVVLGGQIETAAALVDLFILPAFRSREAIATLYGQVEPLCRERGIRLLVAIPNGKAVGVNRRFLGLETSATLDIRAGIMSPLRARRVEVSAAVEDLGRAAALALFARFEQGGNIGLHWSAEGLWARLQDPATRFAVHATETLLLISAPKTRRRVPMVLLCGLLARPGAGITRGEVGAVVGAACHLHRRPLFIYVGRNGGVPLPGWAIPARVRPSIMIVQTRDLAAGADSLAFDRFELIDFDFA